MVSPQAKMGITILNAMHQMGGSGSTPEIRHHMGITRANNFAGNLTDLFGKGYVTKKKNAELRGGAGNIWSITKDGKKHLRDNQQYILTPEEARADLEKRFNASKQRKLNPTFPLHPKVSKGVGQAMDSLATLIQENQNRDALLRSIRSMIDAVLDDQQEEVE